METINSFAHTLAASSSVVVVFVIGFLSRLFREHHLSFFCPSCSWHTRIAMHSLLSHRRWRRSKQPWRHISKRNIWIRNGEWCIPQILFWIISRVFFSHTIQLCHRGWWRWYNFHASSVGTGSRVRPQSGVRFRSVSTGASTLFGCLAVFFHQKPKWRKCAKNRLATLFCFPWVYFLVCFYQPARTHEMNKSTAMKFHSSHTHTTHTRHRKKRVQDYGEVFFSSLLSFSPRRSQSKIGVYFARSLAITFWLQIETKNPQMPFECSRFFEYRTTN